MSVLAVGERRLEAETYLTGGYGLRRRVESLLPHTRLGNIGDVWQPSRLKATEVHAEAGQAFLTATQVFDIRPAARKWLAPGKTPDLSRRQVQPGWILVTRSGSVGDAILAYAPHFDAIISDDLLRLEVRDPKHRGYVYSYLRSGVGRAILSSSQYGSVVKHLEASHLADVPMPTAPEAIYQDLNDRIDLVYDLRERAFQLSKEAESLYSQRFPPVPVVEDKGYTIPASRAFSGRRRLDAYHYNAHASEIERLVRSESQVQSLSQVAERIVLPNRFARVYVPGGIPHVDSKDIFKVNPATKKFVAPSSAKDITEYFVERDWLLVARSGQIYGINGSVTLATERHEQRVVSEHIIRVIPRHVRPGYLMLALGHRTLGRPLVVRLAFGSSVPEIAPTDLAAVPVPRLGDLEDKIADRVEEASALRVRASHEEDAAVDHLERYIQNKLKDR